MPIKYLPIPLIACLLTFGFGGLFIPGEWYASLNRAPWSPPNFAFAIVWSILYIIIAICGWQIFSSNNTTLKRLWCAQLVVNAIWSWIFFGLHWTTVALFDILLLTALIIILLIKCGKDKLLLSSYLFIPYLAWLLLATSLNFYIVIHN